jgi:hypothetical protein
MKKLLAGIPYLLCLKSGCTKRTNLVNEKVRICKELVVVELSTGQFAIVEKSKLR